MERINRLSLKKIAKKCKKCGRALRKYNKSVYCSMCGEKTRIERTKEKVLISILIFGFVIMFFGTSFVSAELFQFDNVKSYDAIKQEVTITNTFGIGEEIAKIKLNTPTYYIVPSGYQKIAEFTINSYKSEYTNPLEQIKFYDLNQNLKEVNKQFDYKVLITKQKEVNKYEDKLTCEQNADIKNLTENCYYKFLGTEIINYDVWENLDTAKLTSGIYTVGVFTQVNIYDKIEWVPKYYGITINEWATYVQSSVTKTYVDFGGENYTVLTYTSNGYFNTTRPTLNTSVLVVGGGGGGGGETAYHASGGGGGGGVNFTVGYIIPSGDYVINIGNGGKGTVQTTGNGTNGGNSSIGNLIIAVGGGVGGQLTDGKIYPPLSGGSGGGGINTPGGSGISGQGNNGGTGVTNGGGGGGGKGAVGSNGDGTNGGNGGAGGGYSIFNTTILYYAGGGGGGSRAGTPGSGGIGGGGNGATGSSNGAAGINGTGGGGGAGGGTVSSEGNGGNGGTGRVIIRYLTSDDTIAPTNPIVTLNSPNNSLITSNQTIIFNISTVDDGLIQNITLYLNGTVNETNLTVIKDGNYTFTKTLEEGFYNWSVLVYDNSSLSTQSTTRTFSIDLSAPIININYPTNTTYFIGHTLTNSTTIWFNWTVTNFPTPISLCWYSNNSGTTNKTINCNANDSYNSNFGITQNLIAWANDSGNHLGSNRVSATWKYKIFEINQSYLNPVLENTPQDYYSSIYLDSSLSVNSVYFSYNGTNYSASYSEIGNYTRLEKTNFYTPSVLSNANNSVSWWVLLNDSSRINLSTKLQQVNNLIYSSVCNATYPYYIFNISLKDEKTQLPINGTIETDIRIKTANGTTTLYNWTSSFYNTSSYLCSNNPISSGNSYLTEGTIKYYASNENYSAMTEYYNLLNFSYDSNTYYQNISLYDLNITEGTEFQLTFKDGSFRTRENILIYVYRQYLPEGIFKVVELPKTDSNGQVVVHLVRNDVIYNLIAVDSSGNVLGTLNNVIAFCEDYTIGNCKINFQGTTSETDLEDYIASLGLSYTLDFDSSTSIISFIFSSATNQVKNIRLEVISSAVVTNRTICNSSLSAITGTLTCDVSSIINSSSSVNVKIFSDEKEIINEYLSLDSSNWNIKGVIFFGFLLLLIIGIMFVESKEGLIISVILGFIVLISLGIVKGKIIGFTSGVLWLIIVGIILLIKLNKEKQQG